MKLFERYIQLGECIAEMFAPHLEVIVHDYRRPESSIIAIFNSHITKREVGGSVTDLGLKRLRGEIPDKVVNYENEAPDGRKLKSTTLAIRDDEGQLMGALCFNFDVSYFKQFHDFLGGFLSAQSYPFLKSKEEFFPSSFKDELDTLILRIKSQNGWVHSNLSMKEKRELIGLLHREGVFQKKSAVTLVAQKLGISRPTVYNTLKENGEV
jgi:predicted transcriptional regulator YheO